MSADLTKLRANLSAVAQMDADGIRDIALTGLIACVRDLVEIVAKLEKKETKGPPSFLDGPLNEGSGIYKP